MTYLCNYHFIPKSQWVKMLCKHLSPYFIKNDVIQKTIDLLQQLFVLYILISNCLLSLCAADGDWALESRSAQSSPLFHLHLQRLLVEPVSAEETEAASSWRWQMKVALHRRVCLISSARLQHWKQFYQQSLFCSVSESYGSAQYRCAKQGIHWHCLWKLAEVFVCFFALKGEQYPL